MLQLTVASHAEPVKPGRHWHVAFSSHDPRALHSTPATLFGQLFLLMITPLAGWPTALSALLDTVADCAELRVTHCFATQILSSPDERAHGVPSATKTVVTEFG